MAGLQFLPFPHNGSSIYTYIPSSKQFEKPRPILHTHPVGINIPSTYTL